MSKITIGILDLGACLMSVIVLRMLLRPMFYWALSMLIYWYLTGQVVDSFLDSQILVGLAEGIEFMALWIALIPFAVGAHLMLERLQILHEWSTEPAAGCSYCGGPQDERTGRYGPYNRCFVCQKNEKIR